MGNPGSATAIVVVAIVIVVIDFIICANPQNQVTMTQRFQLKCGCAKVMFIVVQLSPCPHDQFVFEQLSILHSTLQVHFTRYMLDGYRRKFIFIKVKCMEYICGTAYTPLSYLQTSPLQNKSKKFKFVAKPTIFTTQKK